MNSKSLKLVHPLIVHYVSILWERYSFCQFNRGNHMLKRNIVFLGFISTFFVLGCASTGTRHEMSAADEARYAAAIDEAEAQTPSAISPDATYVVSYGDALDVNQDAVTKTHETSREFEVSRADYDAFFAQSPAIVLGRMTLDPITDGGKLLGYRVTQLTPFEGVDLQNEDIIIGIDGVLPQTPDDYFERWQAAKAASQCTVNIQRGVDRHDLVWRVL